MTVTGTDSGSYSLTYIATGLPAGLSIDPASGEITGTISNSAISTTAHAVTVTASDGQDSSTQTFTWSVGGVSLTTPDNQSNVDSDVVLLGLTATEMSSGTLSFSAVGLPAGLAINAVTGVIDGTISSTAHSSTPHTATVTASDGTYTESETFDWTVGRVALTVPDNQSSREGSTVSLAVSSTDHVNTVTYSATGLPSGLSINSTTGLISGTIGTSAHDLSPDQVTLTAADGTLSDVETLVWSVTAQIALVSPGTQSNAAGDSVSLALTASDSSAGTISYSASGLPAGLSINSSTGVISGTIGTAAAASNDTTVTASDGTYSSSQEFAWAVSTLDLPAIADQQNMDDDVVSLSAAASYHGAGTVTYSESSLPTGLSINSTTGLISGTIANTADANGPFEATVTATAGTIRRQRHPELASRSTDQF